MKVQLLHLPRVKITMLFLIIAYLLCQSPVFAEKGAGNHEHVIEEITLIEAIHRISEQYQVLFNYDRNIVSDIKVRYESREFASVDGAIASVLKETNLKYQIFSQRYVVIYKNDQEGIESLKEMIQHFQTIVDDREDIVMERQRLKATPRLIRSIPQDLIGDRALLFSIEGTVTDEGGEPLIGVNIQVKGTNIGTSTDIDGKFTIDEIDENAVLVVSYIGYQTQEIVVAGKSNLSIVLLSDSQLLDEVVVVGYGTQKKVSLTGSISSTSNKELTPAPVIGVSNALSGLLPGVIVSNRSGQPGQTSSILIRGRSTTGNNNPLVVVDGIPGYSGWSYLNPEDIESISVLKDASAAIYGARAANGVILITTKRGTIGKPTFEYSMNEGLSTLTRIPDMADSELYAEFANEYRARFNQTPLYTEDQIAKFKAGTDPFYPNTDWYRETLKKYTSQRQHRLAMTGGTELLNYLVAASYSSQDGIFKSGNSNFSTYSVMARLDSKINDYLNIGFDLNTALDDNFDTGNPFADLGRSLPTTPVFWPNGMPSSGVTAGANPYIQASEISGYNSDISKRYSTKLSFNLQFPWVKSLSSDGFFVYTNNSVFSKDWSKPYITNSYSYGTQEYSVVNGGPQTPVLSEAATNASSNLIHFKLKYNEEFFNHGISAFVAFEQFTSKSNNFSAGRRDFYSDILDQIFAGGLSNQTTGGSASNSSRQNVFGRLSYNYSEKYLVDFNIRYDGSSNFPKGNRWGFFPGASFAWRVSEENFMKDFTNLDNLKLRLSYGRIGNDQVPSFQWLSTYSITSRGYAFGGSETTLLGLTQGVNPNPYITWEIANMANLGLDLNLWNGKLDATFELFKQRRSNILAKRDLVIPGTAGLRLPDENIGVVDNKGFELNLGTRLESDGGIFYHLGVNMAFARNKIIDVDEAANIPEWQKREGNIIGAPLLYQAVSIIRTEAQLESVPVYPGTIVGHLQYRDTDNNGIISEADMVRINQSSTPEITFGLNFSGSYKNFEVWANVTGQSRAWVQFHKHSKGAGHNSLRELLENRYTPGSMDSKYPIIPDSETRNQDIDGFPSTFWQKDASFIRLKTLQLSYRIPELVYQKVGLKSARVYLSGSNLLTIDRLKWYDPEGDRLIGDFYPQSKVFNLGLNIKF